MLRFDGEADPCREPGSGESPRAPTLWERTMGLPVLSAAALAELCWLLHTQAHSYPKDGERRCCGGHGLHLPSSNTPSTLLTASCVYRKIAAAGLMVEHFSPGIRGGRQQGRLHARCGYRCCARQLNSQGQAGRECPRLSQSAWQAGTGQQFPKSVHEFEPSLRNLQAFTTTSEYAQALTSLLKPASLQSRGNTLCAQCMQDAPATCMCSCQ